MEKNHKRHLAENYKGGIIHVVAFVGNPIWSFAVQALLWRGLLSSKLFIIFWWFIAANLELGVISLKLDSERRQQSTAHKTNELSEREESRETPLP